MSRAWFNFCFENPEKISPNHSALYFFCIEHCNRLGWKEKFGLPTTMAKEAIGIKSYNTYIKTLNDLINFGFILLIEKSKNQYSSNIVALSKFDKARNKALDKAMIKHGSKQVESTDQSNDSINIPLYNNTNLPNTNITSFEKIGLDLLNSQMWIEGIAMQNQLSFELCKKYLVKFLKEQRSKENTELEMNDYKSHFVSWVKVEIKRDPIQEEIKAPSTAELLKIFNRK